MKVYSVLEQVDYEGCSLLGVFGSSVEAVKFIQSYHGFQRQWAGHSYGYVESELGQEVEFYRDVVYVE